ncbi:hypothetical protein [Streptacidiphilus rugosus]|uniref:hypothetical protein n=1 Tax=Streptacidiphilus rugosus TaxID=405783 RepID=UPI000565A0DB|nr:hypothetical protein [Streptacidiphilus rugosus]
MDRLRRRLRELEAALSAEVVLVDRAALDPFAYWLAAAELRRELLPSAEVDRLRDLVTLHCRGYSLILATVLDEEVPLGDHRDRDPLLRREVDRVTHQELATLCLRHQRLTSDPGDQDTAIKAVLGAVA